MTVIAMRPNVAPPPDATEIFKWDHLLSDHELHRFFHGTRRGPARIDGFQALDGTVHERSIYINECLLDAAAARELARALIACADELDELTR